MRVEELRAGTLVNGTRVEGKRRGWNNGHTMTVAYADGTEATYYVGQHVPGSPRLNAGAFLHAADPRAYARNGRADLYRDQREETAQERRERRNALRLALA